MNIPSEPLIIHAGEELDQLLGFPRRKSRGQLEERAQHVLEVSVLYFRVFQGFRFNRERCA